MFEWRKGPDARKPVNPDKKSIFWKYPCGNPECTSLVSRESKTGLCRVCVFSSKNSTSPAVVAETSRLGHSLTPLEAKAIRRKEYLSKGICPDCRREPVSPGKARCISCLGLNAIRKRRATEARKALLKPVAS